MCGIFASISTTRHNEPDEHNERCLRCRGPDHLGTFKTEIQRADGATVYLAFTSTVLALRGDHVAKQPLIDQATGSVLCWNGEAWKISGQPVEGNDGEQILRLLARASASEEGETAVLKVLRSIEGPFAFVYLDKRANKLYFGRDRLGRRSLLCSTDGGFSLSSISGSKPGSWLEIEADGCYLIDVTKAEEEQSSFQPRQCAWTNDDSLVMDIAIFNAETPSGHTSLTKKSSSVAQLRQHLLDSLRPRVLNVPVPPKATAADAKIAVLFSGGLDCTVLARLASDLVAVDEVIDLINVAFESPRIAAQYKTGPKPDLYELCPDRITGRKSFDELCSVCPDRKWRLVTINVPFELCVAHRPEVIRLIHPHNTEMDMSIALALYFASRGQGRGQSNPQEDPELYNTTARVLLSGLGADELFGGYTRHATAFSRQGYPGLVEELKLDVGRLGKRNLGRDDRVMAHWGREVRFPYLDEELLKWAMELPAWEKCDFENPESDGLPEPGKRILRLLAEDLGLGSVAREKKRAIQFGARTAKMENGKVKGTTLIS